jgi:predicted RNA binding protein YcfA (HicA-like mRNA interferase family)
MPKLRTLSGQDVLKILVKFGFEIVDRQGSHVKIRRQLLTGGRQSLTVPLHDEIDKGTLKAIFRQALRYIPEPDLHPHFYTEDK